MALYINGENIKSYKEVVGLTLDEEDLALELPGHILLDEKAMTKWQGNFDSEDAETLQKLLRIDCDGLANKRVRIFIQSMGMPPKNSR